MILLQIAIFIGLCVWCRVAYMEKERLKEEKESTEMSLEYLDPKSKISSLDLFNSYSNGHVTRFINRISKVDYGRIISYHYDIKKLDRLLQNQKASFNGSICSMIALIIIYLILL